MFKGSASIGSGSKICIDRKKGKIIFSDNFVINANSQIWSREKIKFGNNNLISWDNIFIDTDRHSILDIDSERKVNNDREIIIGDNIWIGCRCTILKGSEIDNNTVIAANSVINRNYAKQENVILGGNPILIKKYNIRWVM
ncbi:acyltransferase [Romboutsia sp. Marseille-P6047]|uniref:acyltransferase n=1 Tax=Romboutsia sp. Marseille-P6047 TaxID=2161817 RepID=UPI0013DE612B|nr:acyltransferase [Romboutsia sp. Marseille-P6047]